MKALLKACPRCRGDLLIEASDRERRAYACPQCGARAERRRYVAEDMETSLQRSVPAQQTLAAKR